MVNRIMKILIIEDLAFTRRTIRNGLEAYGYMDIYEADCAEEALRILKEDSPELIILDINLPDRKDLSLLEEIKAEKPDVRVIMHTAVSQPVVMSKAAELGAESYLVKPATKEEIAEAVKKGEL